MQAGSLGHDACCVRQVHRRSGHWDARSLHALLMGMVHLSCRNGASGSCQRDFMLCQQLTMIHLHTRQKAAYQASVSCSLESTRGCMLD